MRIRGKKVQNWSPIGIESINSNDNKSPIRIIPESTTSNNQRRWSSGKTLLPKRVTSTDGIGRSKCYISSGWYDWAKPDISYSHSAKITGSIPVRRISFCSLTPHIALLDQQATWREGGREVNGFSPSDRLVFVPTAQGSN